MLTSRPLRSTGMSKEPATSGGGMAKCVFAKDRSALAARGEAILDVLAEYTTDTEWGEYLQAPFERAAAKGDKSLSLALLKAGAQGCHLHPAIRGGHVELVNELLDLGASASARDGSGDAPIDVAASHGYGSIVSKLLAAEGVDPNAANGKGYTPMHLACLRGGDVPTVKALLGAGAKLRPRLGKDKFGFTPYDLAARSGAEGVMAALREAGASGNLRTSTDGELLHEAARTNNAPMIEFLVVEARTHVDFKDDKPVEYGQPLGYTPLHVAAQRGSCAAMSALMKHGADLSAVDNNGQTPLHIATEGDHVDAVELLCETRVGLNERFTAFNSYPPEDDDWSALDIAAVSGNVAALKALVGAGADLLAISSGGLTVLHSAAAGNHPEMIDALIELGLNVKGVAGLGTPLVEIAAIADAPDSVLALARHGADLNELNTDGKNPLQAAAEYPQGLSMAKTLLEAGASKFLHQTLSSFKFKELTNVFLESGAKLDALDESGQTVLHAAVAQHDAEDIDFLLDAGSNIEAPSQLRRWTPLHFACAFRNHEAVVALLKKGARIGARDVYDHTALHLAAVTAVEPDPAGSRTSAGIVDTLLKAGADADVLNKGGRAPADILLEACKAGSHERFDGDVKRVLDLLRSPDRMWRRRGVWMLSRAYPDRVEVGQESTRPKSTKVAGRDGGARVDGTRFGVMAARLVSLEDENLFRTIMCFL